MASSVEELKDLLNNSFMSDRTLVININENVSPFGPEVCKATTSTLISVLQSKRYIVHAFLLGIKSLFLKKLFFEC